MSDLPDATAAAGGEHYDADTAVARLAELEREKERGGDAEAAPDAPEQSATDEQPSEDGEAAAADEQSEETAPEDGADEPAEEAETEVDTEDTPVPVEKIHGNTVTRLRDGTEVTVGELKRGYDELREYRAKLPELTAAAEKAKAFETRESQIAQQEQLFNTVVPLAIQRLQATLPPAPDQSLLDETSPNYDPIRWVQEDQRHKAATTEIQKLYGTLQTQYQQHQKQMEEARAAEIHKRTEENRQAIYSKVPEFADEAKRDTAYKGIVATVKRFGMTEQDIGDIAQHDSKLVHMIHVLGQESAAYRKLLAQKPAAAATKTKSTVPVQQPGRRISQTEAEQRSYNESFKRWRDSGGSEDGAIALLAMLEEGK